MPWHHAQMSNRRRLAGKNAAKRGDKRQLAPDPVLAYEPELAQLRELMSEAGVPTEMLTEVLNARDADEAIQLLVDGGHLPSQGEWLGGMVDGFAPLLKPGTTVLDAELTGVEFLATLREAALKPEEVPALLADLIPATEASGKPETLAMLRILAAVGPEKTRDLASEAADRMVAGGLRDCGWVSGLGSPRPVACFGYDDGMQESIAITFSYGRTRHAVAVLIDYSLGGGVKDCWLTDKPDRIRAEYQKAARRLGLEFRDHEPSEARAILDHALAQPPCPVAPDQIEDVHCYLELLRRRVALLSDGGTAAPPATKESGRTVHRMKISLHGARPPIWRRLEVPSTATLQQLHEAIQEAFGWADDHLWRFETSTGPYGRSDPELGHRSAAAKELQSVAPRAGDRIGYTYDFGDDWVHEILIEDVLDAEPGVAYPRCVTGRRAGPPEDCGGISGYGELLAILADPGHEEHDDRLAWLGLKSADDFDPAAFDAEAVNKALSRTARVLVEA
jgi:hypothetical protein